MCSQLEIGPVVLFFLAIVMKKNEYTKGSPEAVKRTRTENTMAKRTYNDLQKQRKLKVEQHESH